MPHILPECNFNRISSIIQVSKLSSVLCLCCRAYQPSRGATLTGIYQAVRPKTGYHSLVKFLSRGKWDADAVAHHLLKLLQGCFDNWVYVYDETRALKTGEPNMDFIFLGIIVTANATRINRSFTMVISLVHWGCFAPPFKRLYFFQSL